MNDYPTEEDLTKVAQWKFEKPGDFLAFMEFVKSIGHYWPVEMFGWTQDGRTYHVSTGGWSGNESILSAMEENWTFWAVCWQQSRRGGHFEFTIPDDAQYFGVKS